MKFDIKKFASRWFRQPNKPQVVKIPPKVYKSKWFNKNIKDATWDDLFNHLDETLYKFEKVEPKINRVLVSYNGGGEEVNRMKLYKETGVMT